MTEDAEGPFPWQKSSFGCLQPKAQQTPDLYPMDVEHDSDGSSSEERCCHTEPLSQASIKSIIDAAMETGCISFKLPKPDCVAGSVLHHALDVMESLISRHEPLIFKIGFTHDARWRWTNKLYGYSSSKEKFSEMLVLYISNEPFGPAMLEATLIERFQSILLAQNVALIKRKLSYQLDDVTIGMQMFQCDVCELENPKPYESDEFLAAGLASKVRLDAKTLAVVETQ